MFIIEVIICTQLALSNYAPPPRMENMDLLEIKNPSLSFKGQALVENKSIQLFVNDCNKEFH